MSEHVNGYHPANANYFEEISDTTYDKRLIETAEALWEKPIETRGIKTDEEAGIAFTFNGEAAFWYFTRKDEHMSITPESPDLSDVEDKNPYD